MYAFLFGLGVPAFMLYWAVVLNVPQSAFQRTKAMLRTHCGEGKSFSVVIKCSSRKSRDKSIKPVIYVNIVSILNYIHLMRKLLCVIFFSLFVNELFSQSTLSLEQIFSKWTGEHNVLALTEQQGINKVILFDTLLNQKITGVINDLKRTQVDSFGFFISFFPGAIALDSCSSSNMNANAFLFWQHKGRGYLQKITAKCEYEIHQTDSILEIFKYYKENVMQINKEYLMPVIYKAYIDSSGIFTYERSNSFHQPQFLIFCKLNEKVKFLNFSASDFTDKNSIFLKYNLNTKSYIWFTEIFSITLLRQFHSVGVVGSMDLRHG